MVSAGLVDALVELILKINSGYHLHVNLTMHRVFNSCDLASICQLGIRYKLLRENNDELIEISELAATLINLDKKLFIKQAIVKMYVQFDRPVITSLAHLGVAHCLASMSASERQIFRESGLLEESPTNEMIEWWDGLARERRGDINALKEDVGRRGEEIAINYERSRTGLEPIWQSIYDNTAGYDILSCIDFDLGNRLFIEVKSSTLARSKAHFYLSKNEYNFAKQKENYHLYLFNFLNTDVYMAIADISMISDSIPHSIGFGEWESCSIPFSHPNLEFKKIEITSLKN
jgi:hypothetical protein